jgi:hypothetical protein
MAFIGNTNTTQAFTPAIDYFSGNGSTTAFTLSRPVASVAQVQVTIDNVAQNPSSAYTVSANTITFTSAPLSGTNNIYVYYTSPITQVIAPGQGTVNATSLASSTGTGAVVLATSPTITTPTVSGDATISGLTVGKGTNALSTNTALGVSALAASNSGTGHNVANGYQALTANLTGLDNTGVGYQALLATQNDYQNTAVGSSALKTLNGASNNTAVGYNALLSTTTGGSNVAMGVQALQANTTGGANVAVGFQSLYTSTTTTNTTAVGYQALKLATGDENTAVGYNAGAAITTGGGNTILGERAGQAMTTGTTNVLIGSYVCGSGVLTGSQNVAIGRQAFVGATSAASNVAIGYFALYSISSGYVNTSIGLNASSGITTGANNTCIGAGAGNGSSPSGNLTTQNDRICLGDNNVTNAYIKVSWTVTSDARDKTDIVDSRYGLNFVNSLRPVEYKWDMRSKYEEGQTPDGTHKESKTNLGFLAQEVIEVEKANGAVAGDLLVADDEMDDLLRITETKMIPVLVKAIQELAAKNDALTARIVALENR